MKHKFFCLCLFTTLSIQTTLHAECKDLGLDYTAADIQTIITDYKVNATTITANSYEICFVNEFETDAAFTITSIGNDKIILKGLKIKDTVAPFISGAALLTISSANTTISGGSFTGNGSGAAIQVNGTNIEIKNSTISHFMTGLSLVNADGLALENVTFSLNQGGKNIDPAYLFDPNFFGKKCDKRKEVEKEGKKYEICDDTVDANIVTKVAGKPPIGLQNCSGNVDIYKFDVENGTKSNVASCSLKSLDGNKPFYFAKYANSELAAQEIKAGECFFECEIAQDKLLTIKNSVIITYNGLPTMFNFPEKNINKIKLFNNADVPSTGLGGVVMAPVPSEADTGASDSNTIIVAGYTGATETTETTGTGNVKGAIGGPNIDGAGDNRDSGGGSDDGSSNNSGDGGLVNQEAGSNSATGCTIITGATTGPINRATTAIPFILSLLGLVPITWRRMIRK